MAFAEQTVAGRVGALVLLLVIAQSGLGPQTLGCRAAGADSPSWAGKGRYTAAGDYETGELYSYQESPSSVAPAEDDANAAAAEEAEQPSQQEPVQALTRRAKRLRAGKEPTISQEERAYRAGAHRALRRQERLFSSTREDYRRTRRGSRGFQLVQMAVAMGLLMVGATLAYKYVRTPDERKTEEAPKDKETPRSPQQDTES
ncbi:hypothetical protein CSUI_002610 [Cystoisospora suis]|uniref:Transmembrane protein n=1 Tax=Cystoisospora suis TaxID=483139 RepID=A0A2C6L8T8_9APIC|nr:hypothetical protein CSUI_002610 [Cystoisospora suis]